jgi:acyl carrier protein
MDVAEILQKVCRAVAASERDKSIVPEARHRLIDDLGFDSLRMATLALELETEFDQAILLNDWIASSPNLGDLTVQSLAEYLTTHLEAP